VNGVQTAPMRAKISV